MMEVDSGRASTGISEGPEKVISAPCQSVVLLVVKVLSGETYPVLEAASRRLTAANGVKDSEVHWNRDEKMSEIAPVCF